MARQRGARTVREQREPVVEPAGHFEGREPPGASGGELDREWYAIEPPTDLRDRIRIAVRRDESGRRIRPVDEQLHRVEVLDAAQTGHLGPGRRYRKRKHRPR